MSDSVQPHRRQPTRLPCPWDSPGKNNGVGCHCLLQCVKVKSESDVAQSCPTLSDPTDCSLLVSMNSLGKNTGVGCYSPENLPDPGIKPRSPMMQAGSLLSEPARKPIFMVSYLIFLRKIDPLIKSQFKMILLTKVYRHL